MSAVISQAAQGFAFPFRSVARRKLVCIGREVRVQMPCFARPWPAVPAPLVNPPLFLNNVGSAFWQMWPVAGQKDPPWQKALSSKNKKKKKSKCRAGKANREEPEMRTAGLYQTPPGLPD